MQPFSHYVPAIPGTGAITTVGKGKGIGYTLNVPLRAGLRGATLERVFEAVVPRAFERFEPDVVVMQCGADGRFEEPKTEKIEPAIVRYCLGFDFAQNTAAFTTLK